MVLDHRPPSAHRQGRPCLPITTRVLTHNLTILFIERTSFKFEMKTQDPIGFVSASGAVCASQLRATNFITTSRSHVDGRFATPYSITKHQVKRSTRVRTTSPQVDVPAPANEQTTNNSVRATGSPVEVTESTFEEEVLRSDIPVVVDFYAPWCGPCKLMTPL